MKTIQIEYENLNSFLKELSAIKRQAKSDFSNVLIYITWLHESRDDVKYITKTIENQMPGVLYYGNESAGNILAGDLLYGVSITCYLFEEPDTKTELVWIQKGTKYKSLEDLWEICNAKEGIRAVELIPSPKYLELLKIDSSVPNISDDIAIFGGASINNSNPSTNVADIICTGHSLIDEGLIAILYFGNNFNVTSNYVLGWKGLGRLMKVTKSDGYSISEIDGEPAFSVYEKYLNLKIGDDDNLVFPLILEEDGVEYIRTPRAFLKDKSVAMLFNVPEGSMVRIAYGDKNTILDSLYEKASEIAEFAPQSIKSYSCLARRLFWGDDEVSKETLPLQNVAPVSGYYTGGEILKFGEKIRVLNSTLVLIGFREGNKDKSKKIIPVNVEKNDKSLVSRLTFFAEKIVQEQEEQKIQLIRRTILSNYFMKSYSLAYYCNLESGAIRLMYCSDHISKYISTETSLFDERVPKFANAFVYKDDRERVIETLQRNNIRNVLANSQDYSFTFRNYNGKSTYKCTIIHGEDNNHIAIGFMDITEVLKEEQEAQARLKEALSMADIANKAKTEFLFNMSHDIRTPMNAILGFTQIATKHINDKERVLDCLQKAQQSGDLLLSLINSVLDVSRIESGHAVLNLLPGDIYNCFVNIENTMRELAEAKNLKLTFEFGEIKNRYVYVDFNRCTRVFVNIITNSIKYTNEGGFVKARCEQIESDVPGMANIKFTFEDNGIGMSKEFQKHVFEQFSREKNATLSGIQGTGLGMAVCKSFVELMNGQIYCESEQNVGTIFTVILPLKIQKEGEYIDPITKELKQKDGQVKNFVHIDLHGKKVLLVEDNELNREIAIDILTEEGLRVDEAYDGAKALEIVKNRGPYYYDFILMDIQMPVMNGYEATKALRQAYPDVHIPIIALSANAFAEDKTASLAAGMDDHVAKPINIPELLNALAKHEK